MMRLRELWQVVFEKLVAVAAWLVMCGLRALVGIDADFERKVRNLVAPVTCHCCNKGDLLRDTDFPVVCSGEYCVDYNEGVEGPLGKITCANCILVCDGCNGKFCIKAVNTCFVCNRHHCVSYCGTEPCNQCQKHLCPDHCTPCFDCGNENLCMNCTEKCADCPQSRLLCRECIHECTECRKFYCKFHSLHCLKCKNYFCYDCVGEDHSSTCYDCRIEDLCKNCSEECAECSFNFPQHGRYCFECLHECTACTFMICNEHSQLCPKCNNYICKRCFRYGQYCCADSDNGN